VGDLYGGLRHVGRRVRQLAIVQGVDKIVPVDVYIRVVRRVLKMLIHAVMMLQDKVMKESIRDRRDAPDEEAREAIAPARCQSLMVHHARRRVSQTAAVHDRSKHESAFILKS